MLESARSSLFGYRSTEPVTYVNAPQLAWLVPIVPGSITVTITLAVLIQPALVPVTVYVMVLAGVAITAAVLVADKFVDGAHA